jgi:hypothetical protein
MPGKRELGFPSNETNEYAIESKQLGSQAFSDLSDPDRSVLI